MLSKASRPNAPALLVLICGVLILGLLAYLRDPAWLINVESGLRSWETAADGTRERWTGGHASFFVRSDATTLSMPLRTTFSAPTDRAVTVTIAVDDEVVERVVLTDDRRRPVTLELPRAGNRHVRRIDIRVDQTRAGNRGVAVGELQAK